MPTVLQLQEISKSFGNRLLFDKTTVSFSEGERIGFIGVNGSGKTTLLRMIIGAETPDGGNIVQYPNTRLGYLEQQEIIQPEETGMAYLLRVSGREPWECAKKANEFEITNEQLEKPLSDLSGGYQMRIRLTGMFLKDPNLLLLDEPTNYLDLQTILLLEETLRSYRGALLLISHDREFLKNTCTHTLELEHQTLALFKGDIETYFAEKETRLEMVKRHNKKIRAQQKHLSAFIDRFRYKASKATQAQSKLKLLEKLKTIEIKHSIRTAHIHIPPVPEKKTFALECKQLSVGYHADKPVLRDISIELKRGEHIAVVGENGKGKSTLLKTIAGQLHALSGSYKWDHGIRIAYYAQHVPSMLPIRATVGGYLSSVSNTLGEEDILRTAGNFLFKKDDFDKPIAFLSGGEKARLCLASICLGAHDVLILDEPTNHLDFDTVETLSEALAEFNGTIIFVSHSRTFVSQVAATILEVKDGHAIRYPYPYEIYVYETKTHETIDAGSEDPEASFSDTPDSYMREKADIYEDIRKEKRNIERLEQMLKKLTQEKETLFLFFEQHPSEVHVEKNKRLKTIEESILSKEAEWFEIQHRIEAFEREIKSIQRTTTNRQRQKTSP